MKHTLCECWNTKFLFYWKFISWFLWNFSVVPNSAVIATCSKRKLYVLEKCVCIFNTFKDMRKLCCVICYCFIYYPQILSTFKAARICRACRTNIFITLPYINLWDVGALETPTSTYNHCQSVIHTVEIWRPWKRLFVHFQNVRELQPLQAGLSGSGWGIAQIYWAFRACGKNKKHYIL
jgi:hypothetical protein